MKHLDKKKKILLGAGTAVVVLLAVAVATYKPPQEEARQREYPVKKTDIVVGIDSAGVITSEKAGQFIDTALQIEEYKVKVGDKVKKGDILALLSEKDVQEKWKSADEKLKSDRNALEKLKQEKQNAKLEAEKKMNDLRAAGEAAYQEKAGATLARKSSLESSLAQKRARLEELKQQLQKNATGADLAAKEREINSLQNENQELQRQIDALIADTTQDHAAELAQLNATKTANDARLVALQQESDVLKNASSEANQAQINNEIAQLETEIANLTAELAEVEKTLQIYSSQREQEKQKENESIDLMAKQKDTQMIGLDQSIAEAQSKQEESQKAVNELQKYKSDPAVRAEHDGVVLNLGYKQNGVTDATTPIAEIGQQEKRVLRLSVDSSEIVDVSIGQEVSFYVDAYTDATFYGKVESKSYLQDDKGKYEVIVAFDPPEEELFEGMGANATLVVKQKLDILTVANKAIVLEDGKSYVMVKNEKGELEKRQITTGFSDGRLTEILSGLKDGEVAVVEERYEKK